MTTNEIMLPDGTHFDGTLTYASDVPQLLRNHSAVECQREYDMIEPCPDMIEPCPGLRRHFP